MTIMLNAIAVAIISGLVNDILRVQGPSFAQTGEVGNAAFPVLAGREMHAGVLLAAVFVPLRGGSCGGRRSGSRSGPSAQTHPPPVTRA